MKFFDELFDVVKTLRKKCPWDRVQTHKTLKPYMVEETYEALEAIDENDPKKLCEELGDQLLHVLMHSAIAEEKKEFSLKDVINVIKAKMIRRHPHVFGGKKARDVAEIWERWEEIKKQEKGKQNLGLMASIPKGIPAMYRAEKVQKKASRVGFDWAEVFGAWEKVEEEKKEIEALLRLKKPKISRVKEEIGDLLFALVNVSRKLDISAEDALSSSVDKFVKRFSKIEKYAEENSLKLKNIPLRKMEKIWQEAKKYE